MICVNATAVVAHNRQNRMVMSVFTLQKYCKNGNLQGGKKTTLRWEIPKNGVSKMAKLRRLDKKRNEFLCFAPDFS